MDESTTVSSVRRISGMVSAGGRDLNLHVPRWSRLTLHCGRTGVALATVVRAHLTDRVGRPLSPSRTGTTARRPGLVNHVC